MTYEELLTMGSDIGLTIKEKDLQAYDGRIRNRRVAIRRTIKTQKKKACVLAEELGHYFTTSGDILNSADTVSARKQERRARSWAYDLQIGLTGLIRASAAGCRSIYDTAEFLNVPEQFLRDCIQRYHEKFGSTVRYMGHTIRFDPCLEIITVEDDMERSNDW